MQSEPPTTGFTSTKSLVLATTTASMVRYQPPATMIARFLLPQPTQPQQAILRMVSSIPGHQVPPLHQRLKMSTAYTIQSPNPGQILPMSPVITSATALQSPKPVPIPIPIPSLATALTPQHQTPAQLMSEPETHTADTLVVLETVPEEAASLGFMAALPVVTATLAVIFE